MIVLKDYTNFSSDNLVVIPLLSNNKVSLNNTIILGYFIYDYDNLFYLNKNHPDLLRYEIDLRTLLNNKTIYSTMPTVLYHYLGVNSTPITEYYPTLQWNGVSYDNLSYNKIIPISKLAEVVNEFTKTIECGSFDQFYVDNILPVLSYLNSQQLIINDVVYSNNYILNSMYGRPTNTFNGKSLLSMSHAEKETIKIEHTKYEFDYIAYHMNLISKLIGFRFDDADIYTQLATDLDKTRDEMKKICFQESFGQVHKVNHPFFNQLTEYKENFIKTTIDNGYFVTNRTINIDNINQNNLFSIYLQTIETELNFIVMKDVVNILKDSNSRMLMYIFDSFLFDLSKDEELIFRIKSCLDMNGKLKTHRN